MIYICLNRGTCGQGLPFDQFAQLAADAGFAGCDVEIGWGQTHGASALHDLFESRRLRFGGWSPPVDWRNDQARFKEELPTLAAHAKIAQELKIDTCCTYLLPSSDRPFIENWNFHIERLRPIARILADHGRRFGLEFVAPYHLRRKWPHEFIFTPGQMLELAADVGDNVGLLLDSLHCHTSGTTWEHLAQIPVSKIVHTHVNDAPDVPLAQVEDGKRLLPGEGVIVLDRYVAALRKAGYDGPMSLESFNALSGVPPLEAAKKARAAAYKALASAGVA